MMHRFSDVMRYSGLAVVLTSAATLTAQDLPNIIIIYCDDLGYGDLSCYNPNAAYTTPRLDKMAREGIRFTDAHSPSTICSPSRYGSIPDNSFAEREEVLEPLKDREDQATSNQVK